jgi:hypothetical protein
VKNIIIKIAACGGGEALLSARIIFLQVGAYALTCKKNNSRAHSPSFGGEAAVFFSRSIVKRNGLIF